MSFTEKYISIQQSLTRNVSNQFKGGKYSPQIKKTKSVHSGVNLSKRVPEQVFFVTKLHHNIKVWEKGE